MSRVQYRYGRILPALLDYTAKKLSKAPNSERAKLFTIPKAALQEQITNNTASQRASASASVAPESREAFAEHLESEAAAFKTRTGYIIKKASGAWLNPKKATKEVDPEKESKKADENWLKKYGP